MRHALVVTQLLHEASSTGPQAPERQLSDAPPEAPATPGPEPRPRLVGALFRRVARAVRRAAPVVARVARVVAPVVGRVVAPVVGRVATAFRGRVRALGLGAESPGGGA